MSIIPGHRFFNSKYIICLAHVAPMVPENTEKPEDVHEKVRPNPTRVFLKFVNYIPPTNDAHVVLDAIKKPMLAPKKQEV
jgi:hypothetical protein